MTNIQPWRTSFPIWNQSLVPCPVLTVASWSAYRFLKRKVRWSGIPISFRIFHSLLWSTQSKFLGRHKSPKQTQEETEYLNRATTKKEIQSIILKLCTNRSTGIDSFKGEFYQTFQEELIPIFINSYKNRRRGNTQNLSEVSNSPVSKPDKDITRK